MNYNKLLQLDYCIKKYSNYKLAIKKSKIVKQKKRINRIKSNIVSFESIRGKQIEIMKGTRVDKFSIINSYTYLGFNCSVGKAQLGRYSSVADNVTIGAGEHNFAKISTSSLFYSNPLEQLTQKECIIGNDVWIGVDSIVRRGVTIGDGAVVGANSFVNKDVPDFAIVAGNPAKIIKYRFSPEQIKAIKKSKWWELDLDDAKKEIKKLDRKLNLKIK